MKLTRREVLVTGATVAGAALLSGCQTNEKETSAPRGPARDGTSIDRQTVVSRHNPRVQKIDPYAALTLGNGSFAFTADVTGLQTFLDPYDKEFPLCTMATWAWHTTPHGPDIDPAAYKYKLYDSHGRQVPYDTDQKSPTAVWMREEPPTACTSATSPSSSKTPTAPTRPNPPTSPPSTKPSTSGSAPPPASSNSPASPSPSSPASTPNSTPSPSASNPHCSAIKNSACESPSPIHVPSVDMADWNSPDKHHTVISSSTRQRADLSRTVDRDQYRVAVVWDQGNFAQSGPNEFALAGAGDAIEFTVAFTADDFPTTFPTVAATQHASADHWSTFWSDGAIIDLAASTDPRARWNSRTSRYPLFLQHRPPLRRAHAAFRNRASL